MDDPGYYIVCSLCFNEFHDILEDYDQNCNIKYSKRNIYCDACLNKINNKMHILPNNSDVTPCIFIQYIRSGLIQELNTNKKFNTKFQNYLLKSLIKLIKE